MSTKESAIVFGLFLVLMITIVFFFPPSKPKYNVGECYYTTSGDTVTIVAIGQYSIKYTYKSNWYWRSDYVVLTRLVDDRWERTDCWPEVK